MSRKRKPGAHVSHERWLVSYADFITLLFAFFVVLYASSQVDKARMGKLAVAIQGAFKQMGVFNANTAAASAEDSEAAANASESQSSFEKAETSRTTLPPEMSEKGFTISQMRRLKRELEKVLAAEIDKREVALRIGPEGLVVSLREMGFFNSGSPELKAGSEAALARIALLLRARGAALRVEGHTDNVPIHTAQFNSNWELSTARATEIIKLLIAKYQFSPDHLSAAGYSEFHPVAPNTSPEGRRQNRRLDLVILAAPGQDSSRVRDENSSAIPKTPNEVPALRAARAGH
jgi:chemotaxis protein MotB